MRKITNIFKISKTPTETKRIYVYGNGTYALPFWDRVQEEIDKIASDYIMVDVVLYEFIPKHCIGINCFGNKVYRRDELKMDLIVKPKSTKKDL